MQQQLPGCPSPTVCRCKSGCCQWVGSTLPGAVPKPGRGQIQPDQLSCDSCSFFSPCPESTLGSVGSARKTCHREQVKGSQEACFEGIGAEAGLGNWLFCPVRGQVQRSRGSCSPPALRRRASGHDGNYRRWWFPVLQESICRAQLPSGDPLGSGYS